MTQACILRRGIFDRWFIFHPQNLTMAWSGSRWVGCCFDGLPYDVQVCNFANEEEAREYCREHGLKPVIPVRVCCGGDANGCSGGP